MDNIKKFSELINMGMTVEEIAKAFELKLVDGCLEISPRFWSVCFEYDPKTEIDFYLGEDEGYDNLIAKIYDGLDNVILSETSEFKFKAYQIGMNNFSELVKINKKEDKIIIAPDQPRCVEEYDHEWVKGEVNEWLCNKCNWRYSIENNSGNYKIKYFKN
jgi:hypothetical protein